MASPNLPPSSSSSSSSKYISLPKPQLHHRPHPSSSHHQKPLLLITIITLFPSIYYLTSLYHSLHLPSSSTYGIIIHISNAFSEVRVFNSLNEFSGSTTPFSGHDSKSFKTHLGLSGLGRNEVGLGPIVERMIGFGRSNVPGSEWDVTKVQLFVEGNDGVGVGSWILDECRSVLRSSGFLFRDDWVSILGGRDEGLYNWLAVNYAFGYIGKIPQETVGVIVLARSSMQVSYASNESSESRFSRVLRFPGMSYNLHSQSLRQFGQDAIWKSMHGKDSQSLTSSTQEKETLVSNSCIPRGFKLSAQKLVKSSAPGNFSACKSELMALLNRGQGKCVHPPCELTSSLLSKLERKPHPMQKFVLSSQVQGLVPKALASRLEALGNHFCENDWENLKKQHDIDDIDLSRSCFSHAFIAILLQDDFGIPLADKRVEFAVGSTPVDWKLGAFLAPTIMDPNENVQDWDQSLETGVVGNESISYFLLFAVILVLVLLAAFFVMKLRKPRFKTIYDLEKGRYIITRIPR